MMLASALGPFLGPLLSYHLSLLSPENQSDGPGTRYGFGAVFALPIAKTSELRIHSMYRVESGTFRTFQQTAELVQRSGSMTSDDGSARADNSLRVIEPGAKPYVNSEISLSAVEVGASYWIRLVELDSSGSAVYVGAGVFGDRILSAKQVDNYAFADRLPDDPIERSYTYEGQFGGGGLIGASLVMPLGGSRLVFDLTYVMRAPSNLAGQNIEWLNGRCVRIGAQYAFEL